MTNITRFFSFPNFLLFYFLLLLFFLIFFFFFFFKFVSFFKNYDILKRLKKYSSYPLFYLFFMLRFFSLFNSILVFQHAKSFLPSFFQNFKCSIFVLCIMKKLSKNSFKNTFTFIKSYKILEQFLKN